MTSGTELNGSPLGMVDASEVMSTTASGGEGLVTDPGAHLGQPAPVGSARWLRPRSLRTDEIACRVNGQLEGSCDIEVRTAAPIETAGDDSIAFLSRSNLASRLQGCRAACVIVPRTLPNPEGRTVIRVDDPRLAFARVLAWLSPRRSPVPGVHATAIVHPRASIAAGVSIGPYCSVGDGAEIGEGSVLHERVTVYDGVTIGRRCVVKAGAVIGADGFGFVAAGDHYEKVPHIGGVEIGDDVEIGANCTIDRGMLVATRIGTGTKIDNLVHIAHNCSIGEHVVIAAQTGIAGSACLGDWVVVGGQVGIGDHVRIGSRAVVGAASAIPTNKHVRVGETVWGVPARPLGKYLRQLASLGRVEQLRHDVQELRQRGAENRVGVWAEEP